MTNYVSRKSVKVLLLNDKNELLLIHVDDPKTTSIDGTYQGPFWCLIGGGIKPNESIQEAALREIYEETGITKENIQVGPVVWRASFDFVRTGTPTHMEEQFIVAKTMNHTIEPAQLSDIEKSVIQAFKWFSLSEIKACKEPIFPIRLAQYLPDILAGNYPEKPIKID